MKFYIFLAGIVFAVPGITFAASPSVQSFAVNGASSASINSGQVASSAWHITDAYGASFSVPCTQGIKIKRIDGTAFSCDTSYAFGTNDGVDLLVWNLSGGPKSFIARLTPKDATGVDVPSARQDISVSVATIARPIDSMTGTTTIASKDTYTLSWSSTVLDGVNLSLSCSPSIRTTSTSYVGFLPCNTPIFASDLAGSGSLTLVFDNTSPAPSDITLTLLPAMAPGVYNGAGISTLTVSVDTDVSPDPITTSFAASSTSDRVPTDTPIALAWTTERSSGANFRISCNDNIATTINTSNATSTPRCNTVAFDTALPSSGSATISFANKSSANEPITITLTPGRKSGGFDATRGKDLSFFVTPRGALPATIPPLPTVTSAATPTKASVPFTKTLFTKYLSRGSSNAEVRALQEFLAKDSSLYPEGVISGYFGPATERGVKRFQEKYKIAGKSNPGYGAVGPKTRASLNSLN